MDPSLPRSLRLGDPLRREFLDDLRRRSELPRPLAAEWALADADLVVAVTDDPAELVLAPGTLGGPRRWVLRQPLDDFDEGDLVDAFARDLLSRGHDAVRAHGDASAATARLVSAMGATLHTMARLRPESGTLLRNIAQPLAEAPFDPPDASPEPAGRAAPSEDPVPSERLQPAAPAAGEPAGPGRPGRPRPAIPPPRSGTRVLARVAAVAAFVAAVAAVSVVALNAPAPSSNEADETEAAPDDGAAAASPGVVADYAVSLRNPDGSPVRLEPCHIYGYVVQPGRFPPETAAAEVGAGFAALEEATGVAFRFGGATTERFPFPIDPDEPARGPILVSFEHPDASRALVEGADAHLVTPGRPLGGLALAGPAAARPGFSVLASGDVVVNETLDAAQRARVLLHELGHVAGLDHASGAAQIMTTPVPDTGAVAFRAGDRAGFAELRHDGCVLTDQERREVFG